MIYRYSSCLLILQVREVSALVYFSHNLPISQTPLRALLTAPYYTQGEYWPLESQIQEVALLCLSGLPGLEYGAKSKEARSRHTSATLWTGRLSASLVLEP